MSWARTNKQAGTLGNNWSYKYRMAVMSQVSLFGPETIDRLSWPADERAQAAKRYLVPIIKAGPEHYVDNICCQMFALLVDNQVIPIVIGRNQPDCSFVCSSYSHYVEYAIEELAKLNKPGLERMLKALLSRTGAYFKAGNIDKAVYVNNWLLTTNPCPSLSSEQIQAITAILVQSYPDHAIVFRCVDKATVGGYMDALLANGYKMIGARAIYFLDPSNNGYSSKRNVIRDRKLLASTDYEVIDSGQVTDRDIERIASIYRKLYLIKYPLQNPHFNEGFFEHLLRNELFTFKAFRKNGRIDAFICWYIWGSLQVSSIIGYDTELPGEIGLYRLTMAVLMDEMQRRGFPLNMSGGAGSFKRRRGGVPIMEFNAVYDRHLSAARRLPWQCLKIMYNGWLFNWIAAKT